MSKVYVVTKFGGDCENRWEQQIAVCSTVEVAMELKKRIEIFNYKEIHCDITEDRWIEMYDAYYDSEEEGSFLEILAKLFPEYTIEQLAEAEKLYDKYEEDFAGVYIEEVEYYESESELLDGANY